MYIHPKCLNHFVQHYAYHSVVVDTEAGYAESSVAGGGYGCGVAQKPFGLAQIQIVLGLGLLQ